MSDDTKRRSSLTKMEQIDQVCESFEQQWQAGEQPQLEQYLATNPHMDRQVLLRHLLELDVDYRLQTKAEFDQAEYLERFPDSKDSIEAVFSDLEKSRESTENIGEERTDAFDVASMFTNAKFDAAKLSPPGYEIIEEIARGGMGVVFKARQLVPNRVIALKMVLSGDLARQEEIQRFHAEVEASAKLRHVGIVPVYEFGEHEGRHFFSMAYIEGTSLSARIKDDPLPARDAASLMVKIADAVQFAHCNNVVHRDLKPANILLDLDGEPHVTDFGLAKQTNLETDLTLTGQVLGTPRYMSPEQATGNTSGTGPKSDIYSLGAILYCLVTGRPPFMAETAVDTLQQVLHDEPISPRQLNPKLPNDLETICLKCLEKEPGKRYESAASLSEDLQRYLDDRAILARPIGVVGRLQKWVKRNTGVACLLATVFLVLVAGICASTYFAIESSNNAEVATQNANEARLAEGDARKSETKAIAATHAEKDARKLEELARLKVEKLAKLEAEARKKAEAAEILAVKEAGRAKKALADAEDLLWQASRTAQAEAVRRKSENKEFEAVMYAGRALTLRPKNEGASEVALDLISNRTQALPLEVLEEDRAVWDMAKYPDGSRVAIGYYWTGTKVWDVVTGEHLFTLPGRLGPISEHKNWIFTFDEKAIYISNAENGELVRQFPAVTSKIAVLSLEASAKRLAVVHALDPLIRVFDTETGKELKPFKGHTQGVRFAQFILGGRQLVSYAPDRTIRIWDAEDDKRQQIASIPVASVRTFFGGLHVNPKAHSLSVVGNQTVTFYHLPTGNKINELQGTRFDYSLYGPRGDLFAVVDDDKIRIHNPQINKPVVVCEGMPGAINRMAFSADGTRLAAVGREGTCMVWDARSGKILSQMVHDTSSEFVTFCDDGARLVTASDSKRHGARVWAVNGRLKDTVVLRHPSAVTSMHLSQDGKRLAAMLPSNVYVWDLPAGKVIKEYTGARRKIFLLPNDRVLDVGGIRGRPAKLAVRSLLDDEEIVLEGNVATSPQSVALHPNGQSVVASNENGDITSWNLKTGNVLFDHQATGEGKGMAYKNLQYRKDGERIASGTISVVASLRMLDGSTGRRIYAGRVTAGEVHCYDFSPDGKRLVAGYADAKIRIWDVDKSQVLKTFSGHEHIVYKLRYQPGGTRFVSQSLDGTCRLWDEQSGQQVSVIRREGNLGMFGFEYSPDGSLFATFGNQKIHLHEGESGRKILTLNGHTAEIQQVLFTPDNEVISASHDKTIRVWKRTPKPGFAPEWVARDLVPAISSLQAMDDGSIQSIEPDAWWSAWQRIQAIPVEKAESPDRFTEWLRWQQSDPRTRTISPFSTQTIPEWVEELAASASAAVSPTVRDELLRIAPAHPLTPLLMAGVKETSSPKNHAPDLLASSYRHLALTRLRDKELTAIYGEEAFKRYAKHAARLLKVQGQPDLSKQVESMFP